MPKFKLFFIIFLAFAVGFGAATGIGIYKQKAVAGKANRQIATANAVIADLTERHRELEREIAALKRANDSLLDLCFAEPVAVDGD